MHCHGLCAYQCQVLGRICSSTPSIPRIASCLSYLRRKSTSVPQPLTAGQLVVESLNRPFHQDPAHELFIVAPSQGLSSLAKARSWRTLTAWTRGVKNRGSGGKRLIYEALGVTGYTVLRQSARFVYSETPLYRGIASTVTSTETRPHHPSTPWMQRTWSANPAKRHRPNSWRSSI